MQKPAPRDMFFSRKYHVITVVLPRSRCIILDPEIGNSLQSTHIRVKKAMFRVHIAGLRWELQLKLPSSILQQYAMLIPREAIREKKLHLSNP